VEPATFEPTGDILVSPKNFSIGPKGQRTVRILLKEPPAEKERGYRVLFIPRASEFDSEQVQTRKSGGRSMVLKVLTGIGMLVYVEPKQVTKELDISRTSSGVTFTNRGNIQVNLTAGVVCPASATLDEKERAAVSDKEAHSDFKKKGCVPFERTRIHAGKSLTVPVPNGYRLYGKKRFGALEPHEPFTVDP
jgi:P pilus assembly chaperone PapD